MRSVRKGIGIRKMDAESMESMPVTAEERKRALFFRQKETLDLFLERGAISKTQYDKSLGDLAEKMGFGKTINGNE